MASTLGGSIPPPIAALLADIAAREQRIAQLDQDLSTLNREMGWRALEWQDDDEEPSAGPVTAPTAPALPAPESRRGQRRLGRQPGRPAAKQPHRRRR